MEDTDSRSPEELLAALDTYMASEQAERDRDWAVERTSAANSFERYWADSASASVMRDYRAGRVVEVRR